MSKLVQNRQKLKKEDLIKQYLEIYDKRTYFIANRVVLSLVVFLILTGILSTLISSLIVLNRVNLSFLEDYWIVFLPSIPVFSTIYIYFKRESFYYNYSWRRIFLYFLVLWLSITTYVGIIVDLVLGIGKTLYSGLSLSLYYITGYLIAKKFWRNRFSFNKEQIKKISHLLSFILILGTLSIGYYLLVFSTEAIIFNIDSKTIYEYSLINLFFAIGLFVMLSGFGIVISAYSNFKMLYLLYAEPSWNVKCNSPNKLYTKFLSRTMIWMILFWLFMELFIPPIPNKKKAQIPNRNFDFDLDKIQWDSTKQKLHHFIEKENILVFNEWQKENLVLNSID